MAQPFMATSRSSQSTGIPARLTIVIVLLGLSVFINYIDRSNLSIAAPMLKDELHISAAQLGLLLSAFFWTYASLNLFYGWLVDRVNVNWLFAGAFFLWSVPTAATALVHTFAVLFALRLLLGIGEAAAFPAYNKILAVNFNEEHRGVANSVLSSGLLAGPGFGLLFGGLLMARFGWRPFFLVLGLASLLWVLPWLKWMPHKHQAAAVADSAGSPNLLAFLLLRPAWGTCLGLFFGNYVSYFLLTWLPYYLVRERGFSLEKMARVGGTAYFLGALASILSGWLADRWIACGANPGVARKTFTGGGIALSGLCLGLGAFGGEAFCIAAITLGVIFFGVCASNIWAITQALAGPQAAGRWSGFQNFFGNLAGILSPALTGYVVDRTRHFGWAFLIVTAIGFAGSASWFLLTGPLRPVVWNRQPQVLPRPNES
jgi:ACS family D-galactonate transporter-like MFS transporter